MNTPLVVGIGGPACGLVGGLLTVWYNRRGVKRDAQDATRVEFEKLKDEERRDLLAESRAFRDEMRQEMNARAEEHRAEVEKLRAETQELRQGRDAELSEMKRHIQEGAEERAMLVGNLARVEGEHRSEAARYLAVIGEKNAEIVRQAKVIEEQNRKIAELSRRVSELEKGNSNGSKHT